MEKKEFLSLTYKSPLQLIERGIQLKLMKNGKRDIEGYLTNRDFIQWVKNPGGPQDVFWQAWMESNPDQKEIILRAREIILSMKAKSFEITAGDYQDVLVRLLSRRGLSNKPVGYRHWDRTADFGIFWRVAAILVLVFSISIVIYSVNRTPGNTELAQVDTRIYKTTSGKQRSSFNLPDGTLVWLNHNSQLIYDPVYGETERRVYLEGEAFFDVAKDTKPFFVKSGAITVKALGTSFNVNTGMQREEVALLSGSVQVWIENSKDRDVILQPGEKAVHSNKKKSLEVSTFNSLEVTGWKDGLLHFQDASFTSVKERLEQWYNIKIVVEGHPQSDWNYSGAFQEETLERTLDRLAYTKGFTFSIEDNVVHLKF